MKVCERAARALDRIGKMRRKIVSHQCQEQVQWAERTLIPARNEACLARLGSCSESKLDPPPGASSEYYVLKLSVSYVAVIHLVNNRSVIVKRKLPFISRLWSRNLEDSEATVRTSRDRNIDSTLNHAKYQSKVAGTKRRHQTPQTPSLLSDYGFDYRAGGIKMQA